MFQFLFSLFSKKTSCNKLAREEEEEIVAYLSRGNLSLQEKKYISDKDMDKQRQQFLDSSFDS